MEKIWIKNLTKIFGPQPEKILKQFKGEFDRKEIHEKTGHLVALDHVNLKLKSGEISVIMGLSGCGKSTLIRHLNGLIKPTEGDIGIDGQWLNADFSSKDLLNFRRHKISMVFQNFSLLPHKTVWQNVAIGLKAQGAKKNIQRQDASHWIKVVGLKGYEESYPYQLSGGMKQRVGLARALATKADILLLDEAFSALDPLIRRDMQDLLLSLQRDLKKTIVFITHDLDEALRLGDKIVILREGKVIQEGGVQDILCRPINQYVKDFLKSVNRTNLLRAESIMDQSNHIHFNKNGSLEMDLNRLEINRAGGFCAVDHEGKYLGVILNRHILDYESDKKTTAAGGTHKKDPIKNLISVSTVTKDATLDQMLPLLIETEHVLPVLSKSGHLEGTINSKALLRSLIP